MRIRVRSMPRPALAERRTVLYNARDVLRPDVMRCTISIVQSILAGAVVPGPPIANGRVYRAP